MAAAAMRAGIAAAGLTPDRVGWVSPHGTGTPRSDAAEALALHTVFGDSVPPVSGVKGALGHSLGAATAVEAVVVIQALQERVLPPTAGVGEVDAALGLDVVLAARPAPEAQWVLSNGFAFGGLNSALLLGRSDAEGGHWPAADGPTAAPAASPAASPAAAEVTELEWVSPPLTATADTVAAWAARTLREAGLPLTGDEALVVASPDSGAREALAFWAAAQQTGLAFAAPAAFPWTLSNSPTGRISQELGLTGPCHTLVGGADALAEAERVAASGASSGTGGRTLVVSLTGLDPVTPRVEPVRVRLTARL